MHAIEQQLRPLRRLFDLLAKDTIAVAGKSKKRLSQTKRRSFIRALFAWIEADTFNRKQIALLLHHEGQVDFSAAELALLREEHYDLDPKGQARTQQKFLRLAENRRFGVRCFCKATGIDYNVETGNQGWEGFLRSIKLRNRITHPKNPADLFVSDNDLQGIWNTFLWFKNNSQQISQKLSEKYP
jgi:hypothetical protein